MAGRLTWDDQPAHLAEAEIVVTFSLRDAYQCEIRKYVTAEDIRWFATVGNLFGSQTIRALDLEKLLRALDTCRSRGKPVKITLEADGAELVTP